MANSLKLSLAIALMLTCPRATVSGQVSNAFNSSRVSNFNDYRQKLNAEYERITRKPWNSFNAHRELVSPDRDIKPVTPVVMSDEESRRRKEDRSIRIDEVIKPVKNDRRPQPVYPIDEQQGQDCANVTFTYLGTQMKVRFPSGQRLRLAGTGEDAVADAWKALCDSRYNNTVADCIKLRKQYDLCDWAYLQMLQALCETCMGGATNEATLMTTFIYSQSGYKTRIGECDGRLEMLYASRHNIYGLPYFVFDNEKFFTLSGRAGQLRINAAKYPGEQSLSLWVSAAPGVDVAASPVRTLTSARYPEMSVQIVSNRNLLGFFESYPASEVGGNFMTRWAMYANTPLSDNTRQQLYPALKRHIAGLSQLGAVERLLNWVQTAFVYEYDDKVWGCDRAFFADETLYYPYCDCEDRSILFTRIVRDLLGLRCILVYYPGHLAAAVCFTESVNGDNITIGGRRFVVTDPTYIGASVGNTMPGMDNAAAKVILLE